MSLEQIKAMYERMQDVPKPPRLIEESRTGLLRDWLARHGHAAATSPIEVPSSALLGVPVVVSSSVPLGSIRITHADGTTETIAAVEVAEQTRAS